MANGTRRSGACQALGWWRGWISASEVLNKPKVSVWQICPSPGKEGKIIGVCDGKTDTAQIGLSTWRTCWLTCRSPDQCSHMRQYLHRAKLTYAIHLFLAFLSSDLCEVSLAFIFNGNSSLLLLELWRSGGFFGSLAKPYLRLCAFVLNTAGEKTIHRVVDVVMSYMFYDVYIYHTFIYHKRHIFKMYTIMYNINTLWYCFIKQRNTFQFFFFFFKLTSLSCCTSLPSLLEGQR